MEKLNTTSPIRKQIRAWLKAGVIDKKEWYATKEGTPQGGVRSPLLANIALHGLEEAIMKLARTQNERSNLTVVRYADDFVVIHHDREMIEKAQVVIAEWLRGIGLEFKREKTKVTHTLHGDNPGFDFLGYTVRQFEVSKYRSSKNGHGNPLNYKTLIKPSKKSIDKHKERLAEIVACHKAAPQESLISHLNPVIRGWTNYFRTGVSKETFSKMDNHLWDILWNWAKRRHPNKSRSWIARNYWTLDQDAQWRFKGKNAELYQHASVEIVRHVKVKGKASPYDGNLTYWSAVRFVLV